MRAYTMEYFAKPQLPRVAVAAEVPAEWTEVLTPQGAPSFSIPGLPGARPALTAIGLSEPDVGARVERAIALSFGADAAGVARTPQDGGRVWAVRTEASAVHARMFVPAPHGVVMAVALVPHAEASRLPELLAVFRTVRVESAA